jgi:hypothetical protein
MNSQRERALGLTALIVVIITSVLLFIVKPDQLGDPVTSEYLLKVLLYPSVLILLRAIWKTLLDNKIQSKPKREAEFRKSEAKFQQEEGKENEH